MRISDWSSDVCSSDLINDQFLVFPSVRPFGTDGLAVAGNPSNDAIYSTPSEHLNTAQRPRALYPLRIRYQAEGGGDAGGLMLGRSEERRVGNECGGRCRSRGWPSH